MTAFTLSAPYRRAAGLPVPGVPPNVLARVLPGVPAILLAAGLAAMPARCGADAPVPALFPLRPALPAGPAPVAPRPVALPPVVLPPVVLPPVAPPPVALLAARPGRRR